MNNTEFEEGQRLSLPFITLLIFFCVIFLVSFAQSMPDCLVHCRRALCWWAWRPGGGGGLMVALTDLRAPLRVQANLVPSNICSSRGAKLYGHRNVTLRGGKAAITAWVCRNLSRAPRSPSGAVHSDGGVETVLDHTRSAGLKHQGRACTMLKYTLDRRP